MDAREAEVPEERRISQGLVLLVGFCASDDEEALRWMAEKCLSLRIFADAAGAMNRDAGRAGLGAPPATGRARGSQLRLPGDSRVRAQFP